jgi:hypothetical protein
MLNYKFKWTNIQYDRPTLDILDTKIEFVDKHHQHMLKINFPALEEWTITAKQYVNTVILPQYGDVVF